MNIKSEYPSICVIVPCYNEQEAVAQVIRDFRDSLPDATIYVYDNNSGDETIARAQSAGAIIRRESRQGKGNVVRRAFSDVDADIYIMVDGDATYDAKASPEIVRKIIDDGLDFVNCIRVDSTNGAYRRGHRLGNVAFTGIVKSIFGSEINDMLSGYKGLSRRFVKSFPALSKGFEIETELAVHALALRMPIGDINTDYFDRPAGSVSKLSTFKDGWRILRTVIVLARDERPLAFFSLISAVLVVISLALGFPIVSEFVRTGLVPRLPTAILSSSLMVLAAMGFIAGLILDSTTRGRRETKRLHYLTLKSTHAEMQWRAKAFECQKEAGSGFRSVSN